MGIAISSSGYVRTNAPSGSGKWKSDDFHQRPVLFLLVGGTSLVSMKSLSEAISLRLSAQPEKNIQAAQEALKAVHPIVSESV
jgi:hypothetical protein